MAHDDNNGSTVSYADRIQLQRIADQIAHSGNGGFNQSADPDPVVSTSLMERIGHYEAAYPGLSVQELLQGAAQGAGAGATWAVATTRNPWVAATEIWVGAAAGAVGKAAIHFENAAYGYMSGDTQLYHSDVAARHYGGPSGHLMGMADESGDNDYGGSHGAYGSGGGGFHYGGSDIDIGGFQGTGAEHDFF